MYFLIMKNVKQIFKYVTVAVGVALVVSCDRPPEYGSRSNQLPYSTLVVDGKELPIVEVASEVRVHIDEAIKSGWSREIWYKKIGLPERFRDLGDGVQVIEYIEHGPYRPAGPKLITGVVILLRNGRTVEWDWHYTSF
jgi:hypothetical protein